MLSVLPTSHRNWFWKHPSYLFHDFRVHPHRVHNDSLQGHVRLDGGHHPESQVGFALSEPGHHRHVTVQFHRVGVHPFRYIYGYLLECVVVADGVVIFQLPLRIPRDVLQELPLPECIDSKIV